MGFFISIMPDKKAIPVEPQDIEDAVRRLWQLEEFLEAFCGELMDNTEFTAQFQSQLQEIYRKKF